VNGRAALIDVGGSHLRRYLLPNERLVAEVRWHPVWLARRALVPLVVGVIAGWLSTVLRADSVLLDVAGIVVLVTLGWFAWQVTEWWNERLVITDRRLMLVTGLLTRRIAVMPLRKVTDMTYERPLLGRLFARYGWGTFVMESAGQEQALHRIRFLPQPDELYVRISQEIFGDRGLYGSRGTSTPARPSAPERTPPLARPRAGTGGVRPAAGSGPTPRQPQGHPTEPTDSAGGTAEDPTLVIRLREEDD
jgi:hypothetical protein